MSRPTLKLLPGGADNTRMAPSAYELAHAKLDEAIAAVDGAVSHIRELDSLAGPTTRRQLNAKIDDLSAECARLSGAMQRLLERSSPGPAALQEAPELVP